MVNKIILIIMLLTPMNIQAQEDENWVGDWWDNVYKMRIEQNQYEQIKQQSLSRCDAKIKWYEERYKKDPTSDYYEYKVNSWKEKCKVKR